MNPLKLKSALYYNANGLIDSLIINSVKPWYDHNVYDMAIYTILTIICNQYLSFKFLISCYVGIQPYSFN